MDAEDEIVNNSMLYIQDCKRMLDKGFEDVSDKIKSVGGKPCFELCINEIEMNEIVDRILLYKMQMKMKKTKCTSWLNLEMCELKK